MGLSPVRAGPFLLYFLPDFEALSQQQYEYCSGHELEVGSGGGDHRNARFFNRRADLSVEALPEHGRGFCVDGSGNFAELPV